MSTYPNGPVTTTGYTGFGSRWSDWLIVVLGVWLFITPWIWGWGASGYASATTVTAANSTNVAATNAGAYAAAHPFANVVSAWNSWIVGAIFVIVALWAISARGGNRVEWINVIAALWLFFSPWILGFWNAKPAAAWNDWVLGFVVFFLALWFARALRTWTAPPTTPQTPV